PPAHVVQGLAAALGVEPATRRRSACDGEDARAYRAWLRGQYHLARPSPERARRAVAEFQQVLERDPDCAGAYAGPAYAYRALAVVADAEPKVVSPLARAAGSSSGTTGTGTRPRPRSGARWNWIRAWPRRTSAWATCTCTPAAWTRRARRCARRWRWIRSRRCSTPSAAGSSPARTSPATTSTVPWSWTRTTSWAG